MKDFIPFPGAVITESVRFVKGEYDFSGQEGIIIAADDLNIDGNGAVIRGGRFPQVTMAEPKDGAAVAARIPTADERFFGVAVRMDGRTGVHIRNLSVSGFDIGIRLEGCTSISIEECDLSNCFHDPDWGWDDHGNHGGIFMISSNHCIIRNCRANEVWDALHLCFCDHNIIEKNVFSHTSDTGLKMWRSRSNRIINNDFSWGLRISPGEVHARDSSCVLVESGSNNNVFKNNDMTHGGDGFFIRVLNGWMSTGNLIENNDCSYANNNGIEAWADSNTYIRNKANHCSYGFWLGNSNHTILVENEAAFNGREFHNAPEAFGNAGITFANGSCSHSIIKDNYIHDNIGPGIAIRHNEQTPSLHLLISGNRIENNLTKGNYFGHGIYLKHVLLVYLQNNQFSGNEGDDICLDENVKKAYKIEGGCLPGTPEPLQIVQEPGYVVAGSPVRFQTDLRQATQIDWDLGDEASSSGPSVEHVYDQTGLYSLSVTAFEKNGPRLAGLSVHVLPEGFSLFDHDSIHCPNGLLGYQPGIYGLDVPCVSWNKDVDRIIVFRKKFSGTATVGTHLVLQIQFFSDQEPDWEKRSLYPSITLRNTLGNELIITPSHPMLSMELSPYPEQRGSGCILTFPLEETQGFSHVLQGEGILNGINEIEINCGFTSASQSQMIINAVGFVKELQQAKETNDLIQDNLHTTVPLDESTRIPDEAYTLPLTDSTFSITRLDNYMFAGVRGAVFDEPLIIDRAKAVLTNQTGFHGSIVGHGIQIPNLEYLSEGKWIPVTLNEEASLKNNVMNFSFPPLEVSGLRLAGLNSNLYEGFSRFSAWHAAAIKHVAITCKHRLVNIDYFHVKLNKEISNYGNDLPDLTAAVYSLNENSALDQLLYSTTVPESDIVAHLPACILTTGLQLMEGKSYALVLGQARLAESRESGGYYRWICGKVKGARSVGILLNNEKKPAEYDWGTAWMIVYGEGARTQLVHSSDHVGVRFGLPDVPHRYQVFSAPTRSSLLTDNQMSGPVYLAQDEDIFIDSPVQIKGLYLYLKDALPEALCIKDENDCVLKDLKQFKLGVNYIGLDDKARINNRIILSIRGSADLTEIIVV